MRLLLFVALLCLVHSSLTAVTAHLPKKSSPNDKKHTNAKAPDLFHHEAQKVELASNTVSTKSSQNYQKPSTQALEDYLPEPQNYKPLRQNGPKRGQESNYQHKNQGYHTKQNHAAPQNIQGHLQEARNVQRNQDYLPLDPPTRRHQSAAHVPDQKIRPRQQYVQPPQQQQHYPQQAAHHDQRNQEYLTLERQPVRSYQNTQYVPQSNRKPKAKPQTASRRHFVDDDHHRYGDPFHHHRQSFDEEARRSREGVRNHNFDREHRPRIKTYFQDHGQPSFNVHRTAAPSNGRRDQSGYEEPQKGCKLVEKEIQDLPDGLESDNKNKGFSSKRYMMVKECFYQDDGPRKNGGGGRSPDSRGRSESKSHVRTAQPYEYKFDEDDFFKDFLADHNSEYSHDHYLVEPYEF